MQWLADILTQIPSEHRNTIITMITLVVILTVTCFICACIHAVSFYKY